MHYFSSEFLQWSSPPCLFNVFKVFTIIFLLYFFILMWQSQGISLNLIIFLYYLKK